MAEETLFEKIIKGEIPSVKLYEDDVCIVIMDAFPIVEGQTLVIPKQAIDYAFDLDDATYAHILLVAKKITLAIDKALQPLRTCLVIEGFEVPHAHIKLYPTTKPKLVPSSGDKAELADLQKVAESIKAHL